MMIRFALVAAAALTLLACPPAPLPPDSGTDAGPTPVLVDAARPPLVSDASTLSVAVCANLAALGCKEGLAPNCAVVLDHIAATNLTDPHAACLALAKTKAAARACKSVECP